MNITRENIDELNAILTISVEKSDYQENVDKALANYRKNSNLKGFRKGKAPMGIIKKQHAKPVLVEELNKIVGENLYKYINEQKIQLLGNPLPKEDDEMKGDFDNPDTFEFYFEIGISPELDIKVSAKDKYEYTKVKVDKKLVDKQLEDLLRRYGKLISSETVNEKDLIIGQFVELDEKGEIKEGGILHDSTISMEFIEDKATKKELIGKKIDDKVTVNPYKVSRGDKDTATMLGIEEEDLGTISEKFQLTIKEIKTMELAEVNQELLDKLFGENQLKSEKELRERIESDLSRMFANDSDRILFRRISNDLVKKNDMELPNEFLKKWIISSNKNPITIEEVEKDYENYARTVKWMLIKNSLLKNNDIKIERAEAINYAKGIIANQYAQYNIPLPDDHELSHTAGHFLEDEQQSQQVYDELTEQKLLVYLKETVKLEEKEVDYDTFLKIAEDSEA